MSTTATSYQSGEISAINFGGDRKFASSCVLFNNELWFIGANTDGQIIRTSLNLNSQGQPINVERGDATSSANWSSAMMSIQGWGVPQSYARTGAVLLESDLYLFWNQNTSGSENGHLLASTYMSVESAPGWGKPTELYESDGKTRFYPQGGADVAASAWGDDWIIVGCASVVAPQSTTMIQGHGPAAYIGFYHREDNNPNTGIWPARWHYYLYPSQLQPPSVNVSVATTGRMLSMEWFAAPSTDGSPAPQAYLALVLRPDFTGNATLNGRSICAIAPLTPPTGTSPMYVSAAPGQSGSWYIAVPNWMPLPAASAVSVVRDPAGRLRFYSAVSTSQGHQIEVSTLSTIHTPSSNLSLLSDTYQLPSADPGATPSAGFFMQPMLPGTGDSSNSSQTYPFYEVLLFGHARAAVQFFGTTQVTPHSSAYTLKPKDSSRNLYVIGGIVDGPLPMPNVNIQKGFLSSRPDCGALTYGSDTKTTGEYQKSSSWSIGMKDEGHFDVEGIGAAWDIEMSAGTGNVSGQSSSTISSQVKYFPASLSQDHRSIDPLGKLITQKITVYPTLYKFTDAAGNVISDAAANLDGSAPAWALFDQRAEDDSLMSFVPYSVTPGDLSSYTPEAWDARMGANYFHQIIEANAYTFADGNNYLQAAWSRDATVHSDFATIQEDFTETSWHLDESLYAGIYSEAAIPTIVDVESKVLFGGTFKYDVSSKNSQETKWGLNISDEFGPPTCDEDDAIGSYTFRVYFLPPPSPPSNLPTNYWTQELINRITTPVKGSGDQGDIVDPANIDPNGAAWKIAFVVTSYTYVNEDVAAGRKNYTYYGNDASTPPPQTARMAQPVQPQPAPTAQPAQPAQPIHPEQPAQPTLQDGSLVKAVDQPQVYVIYGGAKFWIPDPATFSAMGFNWGAIQTLPDAVVAAIPTTPVDGTLLKERSSAPVYVMRGGAKCHILHPDGVVAAGGWEKVRLVPDGALAKIPNGSDIG